MIYKANETICKEGMESDYKFFVKSGMVKESILGKCFKITCEGEFTTIVPEGEPYRTTVTAHTDCEVEAYKSYGEEGENKIITEQLFTQNEYLHTLLDIRSRGVLAKVSELCLIVDKRIPLARIEFAQLIGTANETAIRTLSEFREAGFIAIETKNRGIIEVINHEELAKIILQDMD